MGSASPSPLPPAPPASRATPPAHAVLRAWLALLLGAVGVSAYILLLGVAWSRTSGLLAFVPLGLACLFAWRVWRGDRRPSVAVPAGLVFVLALAFAWVFFVVARLPEPGGFEGLVRAPDATLARAEGGTLRLSEVAARGPLLLVFFRGHW